MTIKSPRVSASIFCNIKCTATFSSNNSCHAVNCQSNKIKILFNVSLVRQVNFCVRVVTINFMVDQL